MRMTSIGARGSSGLCIINVVINIKLIPPTPSFAGRITCIQRNWVTPLHP